MNLKDKPAYPENWKHCTLPTAKRLAELGLKQGQTEKTWSVFTHDDGADITLFHTDDYGDDFPNEETYAAPDLSEAMRVLGKSKVSFHIYNTGVGEAIYRETGKIIDWNNKTIFPAEAACRMIVWLAEQGLINLKEVKLA